MAKIKAANIKPGMYLKTRQHWASGTPVESVATNSAGETVVRMRGVADNWFEFAPDATVDAWRR